MAVLDDLHDELAELAASGLLRRLRTVIGAPDRVVHLDGRQVLNFSANNYLGLANHPVVIEAALTALRNVGTGAGASRLIVGNQDAHEALERELAAFHHRPAARLFNSGYNANLGVLQTLAREGDVIFSDALNHASVVDGCRLSRAAVVVYPHCDVDALRSSMSQRSGRRTLVVTESVFSMDGDRAPLAALAELCRQHDAALIVDEAHGTGVMGPGGRGGAADAGAEPEVHIGTLGKGLGSLGAYVAGRTELAEILLNRARSFVFTTALPAPVVAASRAALRLVQAAEGEQLRQTLGSHITRFRDGLADLGLLGPGAGNTPIFPVFVGDEGRAMECSERLLARGLYAQGIRPPTVPVGTARLRFALMATHSDHDIDFALSELAALVGSDLLPRRPL